MDSKELKKHQALIERIGTPALMSMFEITKGAVSQWRTNGIPKARLMYLELHSPELFVDFNKSKSSKQSRKERV
jgi:hypothetical protein